MNEVMNGLILVDPPWLSSLYELREFAGNLILGPPTFNQQKQRTGDRFDGGLTNASKEFDQNDLTAPLEKCLLRHFSSILNISQ